MRRLTGRLCRRFQLIKLRPTHWAICFLWPRCCFSHFLAKTKCDSHYYRVLSSLSSLSLSLSSLFLIPFGRRCKNVVAAVARRHYYYCFYRSFVLLSATLRSFEHENGFVFYDLIIMTAFDYKYYTAWNAVAFFFVRLFYAAHWSCKWFWLRFLASVFGALTSLCSFWQFGCLCLLMRQHSLQSSWIERKYNDYSH